MEVKGTRRLSPEAAASQIHRFVTQSNEAPVQWLQAHAVLSLNTIIHHLTSESSEHTQPAPENDDAR